MTSGKGSAVEHDDNRVRAFSLVRVPNVQHLINRLVGIGEVKLNLAELLYVDFRLGSNPLGVVGGIILVHENEILLLLSLYGTAENAGLTKIIG
jgi:hypothetical protein